MKLNRPLLIYAVLLTLCFAKSFIDLVRFALNSGLFSYVLLVPFISAYLAWIKKKELEGVTSGIRWPAAITAAIGLGMVAATRYAERWTGSSSDSLTFQILAYCCFLWTGGILFLGMRKVRALAFPAVFLVFMAPIPPLIVASLESGLQHASAETAYWFIKLSGIPVYRSGFDFHLPRISLSVAPQCSGIRSSLVLFLTSLIAGYLFFRSAWNRWILALFVIPLGIIRNAFRILVIASLCVRIDPSYIHSPIHHRGGPLFFALSLIPFGIVLFALYRLEKPRHKIK